MSEPNYRHELSFESEHLLFDQIYGNRSVAKLEIKPSSGREWTFTLLSIFLNEMGEFEKPSRRGFSLSHDCTRTNGRFSFFHQSIKKFYFYVNIDSAISVKASTEWLKGKWESRQIVKSSYARKYGKQRTKQVTQIFYFFAISFDAPSAGTKSLFNHTPLMYCSLYDFSSVFHFFVKRIFNIGIPFETDTYSIHEYLDIFIDHSKKKVSSIETLKETINGYLSLDIQSCSSKRKLQPIDYNGETYYIIGGVFVSPFAKSILNSGAINGLLLDTTWKVMPLYVTSFIMASVMNIGIPLGFAFGIGEDKTLYERHFKAFADMTGIDVSKFVILSDQGSALKAICDEKFAIHLACLRHLLVSLRFSNYSYAVGELLKCASLFDSENAFTEFSNIFSKISKEEDIIELNKILGKVGLNFADKSINLVDEKRWNQVSMLARINYKMPSTTNSLESFHGHLNKRTPRRNGFWDSIHRLCEAVILKKNMHDERIRHNYSHIIANTLKKQKATDLETMILQQQYYSTTVDGCHCSQNKLIAEILGVDVPCSHRIAIGAKFPDCPSLNIEIKQQVTELKFDLNLLPAALDTHAYRKISFENSVVIPKKMKLNSLWMITTIVMTIHFSFQTKKSLLFS